MQILSKENSSTIKDSIARKLIQTIANQYKDPSKNPIKFYKDKLKEFQSNNPNYSRPSLAYDTAVPAISSLVLNDSPLFNKLLDFQNSHQTNSQDNHNHGSKLVISEILIKKIKELIDEGSELDPEINEFYQKVEKLKITLNDPAFNSQDAIKSSLQEISNSKEENIKHLYSVKIINGIINIPVYSEVGKYKPIENNNFQEFVLKCKEKPEAGHSYLPYFDAVGNPHLMKIKKEQNLTNPNQYQIKLFNTVNKEAFSSDFDLPNLTVNNSQTYYLQARETLPRALSAYQQSHSYGQDYPMQISAQQYSVTPSFSNPVPLTYYQQHPQQSQFLSYYQQQPQYSQQYQYRQYGYIPGQSSYLGHQQQYPSGSFQPSLFRNLENLQINRNQHGNNQKKASYRR